MSIKKFLYTIDVKKVLEDNNIFLEADNKNIIQKDNRPYYVSVSLTSKHSAFIPIRTNLRHNFGYITKRHNRGKSGLDYTKSLIIEKSKLSSYLVKESGISLSEAKVIQSDQSIIHKNYQKFIFETFIPVFERDNKHRTPIEKRLVSFSSLQYFEKTLLQVKQERRDENMPRKNEDKEQWKQELLQKAETQLEEMSDSESFKKYLNTLAKFPNYSVNNVLLIQAQNPQATLVSGYKDWQKKFNRHVNKGAKALYITAPIIKTLNEEEKKKCRKIDFEDMLIQCRDLFFNYPDILKKWQDKFRYILVDEFQDVNQAQYDVVRMLAEPQNNLFVVGDDDQSVYGFRGAKPGIMMEFMKDYPKAKRVLLDINYRSSAYIVNGALRVIGNNKIRFEKKIEAFQKADETVHVQEVKDPVQEAEYVLERIREYREKGVSYTEMAVLYRTNVDARAMSELMTEYQIPFVMKEHLNNIYEHFIALDMISYLRLSQGEYDRKYFLQIANRPNRYLTRESMKTGNVSYESLRRYYRDKDWMVDRIDQLEWDMKMICDKTPYAAIQYIRKRMGYDEFLKEYAAYRKISSEDLFAVLEEIWQNSKGYGTIKEWFEHIESYGKMLKEQNKKNGEKEGVNLMTMHAAKGLEFDTVFVIEANEGSCPYKKATTDEEIEEERRLFYVAMTRAKRKLVISYVKEKNGKDLLPSRFVSELLLNV